VALHLELDGCSRHGITAGIGDFDAQAGLAQVFDALSCRRAPRGAFLATRVLETEQWKILDALGLRVIFEHHTAQLEDLRIVPKAKMRPGLIDGVIFKRLKSHAVLRPLGL
jgi:hypothetical protein